MTKLWVRRMICSHWQGLPATTWLELTKAFDDDFMKEWVHCAHCPDFYDARRALMWSGGGGFSRVGCGWWGRLLWLMSGVLMWLCEVVSYGGMGSYEWWVFRYIVCELLCEVVSYVGWALMGGGIILCGFLCDCVRWSLMWDGPLV